MSSAEEDDVQSSAAQQYDASPIEDPDEDTIRIMLSTDNHLGYAEGDPVRGNDSFAALEEVLYLAKHYGCDMVLLAGDLFHDNKPSRRTMYKAMQLFRKYCMGPDPISVQILSDQAKNFREGKVNYQNEFYSVDLPVMSIHGNHDDPSREGTELYAALDLLDCTGLVNYIGRQDQINQIQIAPILMKKGSTHLALYGLGSMRDERLNRMWQGSKLTFLRPDDGQGKDSPEFFNLFALHQNRDKGRGAKNCVHESMIPEWMDLVCWGHEHECNIDPQESVVGTFRITQPGSSVATSLVAGEAVSKRVGILDIRGQAFRLRPIPLTQVRTFVLGEVSLQETRNLDPDDPRVEEKMKNVLKEHVQLLLHQAREKQQEMKEIAKQNSNVIAHMSACPLSNVLDKPDEFLVRLKVEHSGFGALNNQRFGAQFVGQVANPTDILLFQRKRTASQKSTKQTKKISPIAPDELEEMHIEELIIGELDQPDRKLELFDEKRISNALVDYVQKQQAQALNEVVKGLLSRQQKKLLTTKAGRSSGAEKSADGEVETGETEETLQHRTPRRTKESVALERKVSDRIQHAEYVTIDESDDGEQKVKKRKKVASNSRRAQLYNEESDEEDYDVAPPKQKSRTARTKQPRRAKPSYTMDYDSAEEDSVSLSESRSQEKTTRKAPMSKSTKRRSRRDSSGIDGPNLSQSQLSFAPIPKNRRNQSVKHKTAPPEDSDNSYDDDDDWGTARAGSL